MKQITKFNGWILSKINRYLMTSEGCEIEKSTYTASGARTILRDAFGYRYEVTIEMLGRTDSQQRNINEVSHRNH